MKILKMTEHESIICPALNTEISVVDCYETRFGISNILESIGIDEDAAMMNVCNKCSVGKKEYKIKRTIEYNTAVAENEIPYSNKD